MQRYFRELYLTKYFLLFVGVFAYVQSIQIRLIGHLDPKINLFTPEAALITLFCACLLYIIMGSLLWQYQKKKKGITLTNTITIFFISLVIYLAIKNLVSLLVALVFGTFERNFNAQSFLFDNSQNIINVCIYGGFFLAHYFYQKSRIDGEKLVQYDRMLAENRITQLKAQLNPHFLFNNLNVLDQLINEDKHKASDFLNEFADLYRYLLYTSERQLVPLEEELDFAQNYFNLMQYRYGTWYTLKIINNADGICYIPPLTLQLLLENAFQHNLGSDKLPVRIFIKIDNEIVISNNIVAKTSVKSFGGRGLQNLKEQYAMLSSATVEINKKDEMFIVRLPLIHSVKV